MASIAYPCRRASDETRSQSSCSSSRSGMSRFIPLRCHRRFSGRVWISPHSDRSARDSATSFAGCPRAGSRLSLTSRCRCRLRSKSNAILLLFPYFARTSSRLPEPDSIYPRDRLFSIPQCPATHALLPEGAAVKDNAKLGTYVRAAGR